VNNLKESPRGLAALALACCLAERDRGRVSRSAVPQLQQAMARMTLWLTAPGDNRIKKAAAWVDEYNRAKATNFAFLKPEQREALERQGTDLARLTAWFRRAGDRDEQRADLERQLVPLSETLEAAGVDPARRHRAAILLEQIAANTAADKPLGDGWGELRKLLGHAAADSLKTFWAEQAQLRSKLQEIVTADDPLPTEAENPTLAKLHALREPVAEGAKQVQAAEELARLQAEKKAAEERDARIQALEAAGGRL
jgi:hypothetical protein